MAAKLAASSQKLFESWLLLLMNADIHPYAGRQAGKEGGRAAREALFSLCDSR
jgi:hypothetical protein